MSSYQIRPRPPRSRKGHAGVTSSAVYSHIKANLTSFPSPIYLTKHIPSSELPINSFHSLLLTIVRRWSSMLQKRKLQPVGSMWPFVTPVWPLCLLQTLTCVSPYCLGIAVTSSSRMYCLQSVPWNILSQQFLQHILSLTNPSSMTPVSRDMPSVWSSPMPRPQ